MAAVLVQDKIKELEVQEAQAVAAVLEQQVVPIQMAHQKIQF